MEGRWTPHKVASNLVLTSNFSDWGDKFSSW